MDPSADSARSFASKDLLFVSNARRAQTAEQTSDCPELQCRVTGCYTFDQKCDGRKDCAEDDEDEVGCEGEDDVERHRRQIKAFRLSRWAKGLMIDSSY